MGRHQKGKPEGFETIQKYQQFGGLVEGFGRRAFANLLIVGPPGTTKSKHLEEAARKTGAVIIKGRCTPIEFYSQMYHAKDRPIIIDDTDDLLGQKQCRQYLKDVTETDPVKKLAWNSKTTLLEAEGIPKFFTTTSPVCIICNYWSDTDPICNAIRSRSEAIYFCPTWEELYAECAKWFPDQEIFDYVHSKLGVLTEPDCRMLVKALARKKAQQPGLTWKALIDAKIDDDIGLAVREVMDDPALVKSSDKVRRFIEITGAERATYFRRAAEIKEYRPTNKVPRLKAQGKKTRPTVPKAEPKPKANRKVRRK